MAAPVLAGRERREALTRDTIAALSSGRPPAAVAVLRVSGPAAFAAARAVAGRLPAPRRAALRWFRRPSDGARIDRGLCLVFPGPRSATGEDVVEFHCHGGVAVVAALLEALAAWPGVRLAEPGEFTRRAFDAGRLDLTQVEGLADLLAATTEAQRAQALAMADGALRDAADGWRARLIALLAQVEAELDFAEEEGVDAAGEAFADELDALRVEIAAAAGAARAGERVRDGLSIAIVGPPNVGKSSLLNALAGRDASIVAPSAGTTRDLIEVALDLDGVPVTLVDTAGLRDTDDPVEAQGIARARARAERADLVLDLATEATATRPGQLVVTKIDLSGVAAGVRDGRIHVSAVSGAGMRDLRAWLTGWARRALPQGEPALVARARQRDALINVVTALAGAGEARDAVLRAEGLRGAARALARLSGAIDVEHVLDAVFSRFCVGK